MMNPFTPRNAVVAVAVFAFASAGTFTPGARPHARAEEPAAKDEAKDPEKPDAPAEGGGDAAAEEGKSLFDGKTLEGWKRADFGGGEEPEVEDGAMILPSGATITGAVYTGETPKINYEVSLEAKRVEGTDFFCGFTFPYKDSHASLIVGGWGGGTCGISSVDGFDAADNNTSSYQPLKKGQWYKIRLRATETHIQAWIGDKRIVNLETTGRKISTRSDIDASKPFGFTSYQTRAALCNIRIKPVDGPEVEKK